ncbi:ABC-type Fe3+ transport system, periplasmic component [Guyanagaster necrorhizus]|uniref:ABC-type Fe3+ transport system, periplasmic component n=1 Tax=Guyanagaster necrorhizus TaxID=856835 RepID=A0A9P7VGD8_9AGAR|nr:ABC-type Fe3+ transport system, periplasmic component [Guyanagaster necrorhizus MCA 3950]KAG7439905.1 ABC-type Fe3+ transport system, periplasmic component [Guyanagaster necrorhizus MCA 3950]
MRVTLFLLTTYFTVASAAPLFKPIFGSLGGLSGSNISSISPTPVAVETQSLDELYELAIAEGGQLLVRAGGDTSVQQDPFVQSFQERFPNINITITVDLSKYQDGIIDRSLNLTGKAGVDVAHLQTYHDFVRWKSEGRLLKYKPAGWDQVPDDIKDPDGAFVGMAYYLFSNTYATAKTNVSDAPKEFLDYLDPKWQNRIVSTYPNDDDAVLFEFYKIQQTHGWQAIYDFIAQGITWVRGTATLSTVLLSSGTEAVTFTTTAGFPNASTGIVEQLPPDSDSSTSVIWAQRAAIFNTAEHPAAAQLYMNWLLSVDYQSVLAGGGWSVRSDVPPKEGLKPLGEYGSMLDTKLFDAWMLDRELVEQFRLQFEQLLGLPQGPSPIDAPMELMRRIGVYR